MHRALPLLPLALATAACTAGPDYAGPPPVSSSPPVHFVRAGTAADTAAPGPAWWTALRDPLLDELVRRAFDHNPDLDAAAARIRQARASLRQERANGLPSINASAIYAKARLPGGSTQGSDGSSSISQLDLYNIGFDASWEFDLFGGHRRAVEAARANAGASEASLADARVSLSAEVAQAYVNLRERQRHVALGDQAIALQEQGLELTRQRYDRGTTTRAELLRQQGEIDNARAQLLPLRAELDAFRDELAVLTGEAPGTLDTLLDAPAAIPLPPAEVAIGDPAALLRRRPDIRAAERKLAAQTARIGTAEAARFPRVSFLGLFGLGGSSPSDLVDFDQTTVAIAPQLRWSFLDFGRSGARVTAAKAQRDEAAAQYRATVLAALQDAEGALSRFQHQREGLASLARAERKAAEGVTLAQQRYDAGTAPLTQLLEARRQHLLATQAESQASAALTGAFIAVQKALGLGWEDAPPAE